MPLVYEVVGVTNVLFYPKRLFAPADWSRGSAETDLDGAGAGTSRFPERDIGMIETEVQYSHGRFYRNGEYCSSMIGYIPAC